MNLMWNKESQHIYLAVGHDDPVIQSNGNV